MQEVNKKLVTIEGAVDSVMFKNENNGYIVLVLDSGGEPITVVGELGDIEEGEELRLTGQYQSHPKFGMQFRAELCERSMPTTAVQIQRYLASGVISGLGPVVAKKMVAQFGDETLDIIENAPDKLAEIEGVSLKKALEFSEEFKKVYAVRNLMSYLSKFEVSPTFGIRAWKRWAANAVSIINENPYSMCSVGVDLPFYKAEEIAQEMQFPRENDNRIKAGIQCCLLENANAGHTCLPLDKLLISSQALLQLDIDEIMRIINSEVEDQNLFIHYKKNRPFIFLRDFYNAERYISNRLCIMKQLLFNNGIDLEEVIAIAEEQNNIKYQAKQRDAIITSLSYGFMVLTGGPGTGKTTTLNAIISLFEQQGMNVMIAAPTGRAAKRISDLTGYAAKTIHRLLEFQPSGTDRAVFKYNDNEPLDCDVLIIDEMSMVDSLLFESVLKAVRFDCKLIMVGDADQLPSVGAGNLLRDIIDSKTVPVVELTEIFRQAEKSAIVTNAHKIINGELLDLSKRDSDFFFLQKNDFDSAVELTANLCSTRLPKAYGFNVMSDIQVLSPTRKGQLGTVELNKQLQKVLNPSSAGKGEIKTLFYTFRLGDKVMQTRNNYEIEWVKHSDDGKEEKGTGIFNGDIGIITYVNKVSGVVSIDFEGRKATYTNKNIEQLELAYAVTVHKSQGSEFEAVILTVLGCYDKLCYRNLLYTAVTRAKKLLVIVGDKERIDFMINNNRRTLRYSCLKDMLVKGNDDDTNEASAEYTANETAGEE